MLVIFLLAALGPSIPQVDVNKICQNVGVESLPEDRAKATRGCVGDETLARDQIRREWGRYSTADKGNCASTPGMQFSYVELLTCMEMQTRRQLRPLAGRFPVAAAEAAFAASETLSERRSLRLRLNLTLVPPPFSVVNLKRAD
jgi:hypothetical protein